EFGLESPAVGSEVDEFRRVILARQKYEPQADAQNGLLRPVPELLSVHRRATFEVYRKPNCCRQEAGAVRQSLRADYIPPEITNTVWQRNEDIGATSKKI